MAEAAPSCFATAVRHNARDMIGAFVPRFPEAALPLVRGPAQNITRLVFHYERLVGETDLVQASHWLLPHFTHSVQPIGLTAIPPGKPLLVVSNHPGVMDAMALFAWLARPDLKVITAERPILTLLPNIAQHLILLPDADAASVASACCAQPWRICAQAARCCTFPLVKSSPIRRTTPAHCSRWRTGRRALRSSRVRCQS